VLNHLGIGFVVIIANKIFWNEYGAQIRAIAPRHEALETPVNVTTETYQNWRGDDYTAKTITKLNNEGVRTE
jgi:hypothetical protein